jgi:hypothetical protein
MSTDNSASIVSKVWNYAHVLKNAGVGYGDYVEQITYLFFLKLADEMTELGFDNPIPDAFQWSELSSKSGDALDSRITAPIGSANLVSQRHVREVSHDFPENRCFPTWEIGTS